MTTTTTAKPTPRDTRGIRDIAIDNARASVRDAARDERAGDRPRMRDVARDAAAREERLSERSRHGDTRGVRDIVPAVDERTGGRASMERPPRPDAREGKAARDERYLAERGGNGERKERDGRQGKAVDEREGGQSKSTSSGGSDRKPRKEAADISKFLGRQPLAAYSRKDFVLAHLEGSVWPAVIAPNLEEGPAWRNPGKNVLCCLFVTSGYTYQYAWVSVRDMCPFSPEVADRVRGADEAKNVAVNTALVYFHVFAADAPSFLGGVTIDGYKEREFVLARRGDAVWPGVIVKKEGTWRDEGKNAVAVCYIGGGGHRWVSVGDCCPFDAAAADRCRGGDKARNAAIDEALVLFRAFKVTP